MSVSEELWSEFKRLYMEGLANEYTPHDDCLRAALEAVAPMLITEAASRIEALERRNFFLESEVARLSGEIKGMTRAAA
jgi:hypothetical protein